eukprot:364542-Chlamydomonas_euryale.AAC.13
MRCTGLSLGEGERSWGWNERGRGTRRELACEGGLVRKRLTVHCREAPPPPPPLPLPPLKP